MNVVIVAAGRGRRMAGLTKDMPKCLLSIGQKKIIDLMLDNLNKAGLKNITIVVGYQQEKLRDYLGRSVNYVVNPIYEQTNSMYSLNCASDYFGEEFLYLHSDIVFEEAILSQILCLNYEICLAVDEKILDAEDMKVRVKAGLITEINKAIALQEAKGEFIGIAKFKGEGVNALKKALNELLINKENLNAYFEAAIEYLARQGKKVYPSFTKGKFYAEVDCARNLSDLKERFLKLHL